jgi:hypothetical protein
VSSAGRNLYQRERGIQSGLCGVVENSQATEVDRR